MKIIKPTNIIILIVLFVGLYLTSALLKELSHWKLAVLPKYSQAVKPVPLQITTVKFRLPTIQEFWHPHSIILA